MAGKKGRSGRTPLDITVACQHAISRYKLVDVAIKMATSEATKDSDRVAVLKLLLSYGYGQPAQKVDVTSGGKPLLVVGAP